MRHTILLKIGLLMVKILKDLNLFGGLALLHHIQMTKH